MHVQQALPSCLMGKVVTMVRNMSLCFNFLRGAGGEGGGGLLTTDPEQLLRDC